MKTTIESTELKAKVLFINENWSVEFLKTKKDFVMYLTKKSLPNFDNIGGKLPKLGVKFAKVVNDNKDIEIWERIAKNKARDELSEWHEYIDGTIDQPLLTPETVRDE